MRKWLVPWLLGLMWASTPAFADPVWFEVGAEDPRFPESFLVPIDDLTLIELARRRAADGEQSGVGAIVVAAIRAGGDGLNRNLRAADHAEWNWHVSEVLEFADQAIELCDGWPGFIAEDPRSYIANTYGRICFWGYSIKREVERPRMRLTSALDGMWAPIDPRGQGIMIDVLQGDTKLGLAWLTWQFDDSGQNAWLIGASDVSNCATHECGSVQINLLKATGGSWNAGTGPKVLAAGHAAIEFTSCSRAVMSFEVAGARAGVLELQRFDDSFDCSNRALRNSSERP
jgi:hypothetical protein